MGRGGGDGSPNRVDGVRRPSAGPEVWEGWEGSKCLTPYEAKEQRRLAELQDPSLSKTVGGCVGHLAEAHRDADRRQECSRHAIRPYKSYKQSRE